MRNGARRFTGFALTLAASLACGQAIAQTAPAAETCCTRPQSPRSLTQADWDYTSAVSTVQSHGDSISYEPRAGVRKTLHRCSQHYHCHIENVQACNQEGDAPAAGESTCPETPPVGSWIEVHTAYHDAPAVIPTPENLGSCDLKTVVVVGYHAKVTADPVSVPPIPAHFGPPAAEWTGSSTGPDKPSAPECKVAAFWHFTLGCEFKLSQQQLVKAFHHADEARGLQPPNRLSKDLTHIVVPKRKASKP